MTHPLSDLRDQLCKRADLHALAVGAGFVPVPGRTGWYCHAELYEMPSVRERGGRMHCFHCNQNWSAVDLVMHIHDCAYVQALKIMAAEQGVPWPNLDPRFLAAQKRAAPAVPILAQDIPDFTHGLQSWTESRIRDLIAAREEAWKSGEDKLAAIFQKLLAQIPHAALAGDAANPMSFVRAYRRLLIENPGAARAMRDRGREDRKDAEHRTRVAIDSLAARIACER